MCEVVERFVNIGIEQGIEQGVEQSKRKIAVRLYGMNMSIDFIADVTECTKEKIIDILKENNIA